MFLSKKSHSWYWYTAGSLLFCLVLFAVAKFFLKTVSQLENTKKKRRNNDDPLFI
jgi:hypothetical protein